jgi:hypothetical protein
MKESIEAAPESTDRSDIEVAPILPNNAQKIRPIIRK